MRSIIDELARASMITEAGDLNRLVEIQEQLTALSEAAASDGASDVADAAGRTAELVDSIILRSVADPSEAIESMRRTIGELQAAVSAAAGPVESEASASDLDSDDSLLTEWIAACRDGLTELEADVLSISSGDGDRDELTQSARRRLHTIKGECGVLSLHEAQKVCHSAETLIDERPEFPVDATLAVIDWLRSYVDMLSENPAAEAPETSAVFAAMHGDGAEATAEGAAPEVVDAAAVAEAAPATAPTIEDADAPVTFPPDVKMDAMLDDFACEAKEHIAASEGALLSLEDAPTDNELINTVFRAFHTIKGVAGFMNLEPIIRLAHIAETLLDRARNNQITLDSAHLDLILHSCDMMSQLIAVLVDDGQPPTRGVFEGLIHRLGEAVEGRIEASAPAPASSAPKSASSSEGSSPAPAQTEAAKTARRESDQTVKVSTERMDALVTMVGELVIAQQMVVQDDAVQSIDEQRTQRNLTHMGKIIRDLQEVSMSLRMVTLRGVFQRMARLVRDLSKKSGKRINFRIEGEDTELDRTVVEEIADPLVHMIRNACDHGLEPADERVAAGKDPTGTLTLRAYHSGGSIVIEISEDGRGLNRDRILSRAKERGLIPPEKDLSEISDQEAHNMIFLPGFSTAEKITDISGRGVGMDVVRRNIEALRGKVEIRSKPGEGSTFLMRLPLTMAIIDGMVVRVGTQRYVIPTLSIERSFRPTTADLHSVVKRGEMVSIRGALLPVYRLKGIFGLTEGLDDITEALLIVLETNHSCCCLLVDEIIGQQQVVIKSLGQGLGRIRGVSGGAILGDGRVALIVDVEGLVAEATKAPGEARVKEGACG